MYKLHHDSYFVTTSVWNVGFAATAMTDKAYYNKQKGLFEKSEKTG